MIELTTPSEEIFEIHQHLSQMPETVRRDWQIRTGMEAALNIGEEQIALVTKELARCNFQALYAVQLQEPIVVPQQSENGLGTHNELLKSFAFDAYETLQEYFGNQLWCDWYILPYYSRGDDTGQYINLGVFVDSISPASKR